MSPSRYCLMELYLLVTCVLITVCASSTTPSSNEDWETWKAIHGKKYSSKKTESLRKEIWQNNLKNINAHNSMHGNSTYIMVMNSFGDLTEKEFAQFFNTQDRKEVAVNNQTQEETKARQAHHLPESVDWRTAGYVTSPKYQGRCSGCWAFSATGALEGQMFKKTGSLITLSEQNLIDCAKGHGTYGCNGGWASGAFDYIRDNGGIEAMSTYAYTAKDGESCKYCTSKSVASIMGYEMLPYGDEEALTRAVADIGPIAVVIDAGLKSWQFYSSGVYYDANCRTNTFNHAVLVVGYGVQSGMKHYIVKNSWGKDWGQSGYIYMSRGRNNNCGIASYATYPLV
ncbi:cathepsin K-like [Heptranchias perlo]|uniref:cathepsin K-like n=1 Tax=Heptranchias perlo TaxID=212740 RepID=UPI00355A5D6C